MSGGRSVTRLRVASLGRQLVPDVGMVPKKSTLQVYRVRNPDFYDKAIVGYSEKDAAAALGTAERPNGRFQAAEEDEAPARVWRSIVLVGLAF